MAIDIKRVVVGYLEENCYIVTKNNQTVIIDPGDDAAKIIKEVGNKNVVGVLVTHHHFDHIGALKEICNYYHVSEVTSVAGMDFEVIKTPGHTSDSVSFYFKNDFVMFTGDFIFLDDLGRCDLPTGSEKDMVNSLELIKQYPDEVIIYPGHGDKTTLGHEKRNISKYI